MANVELEARVYRAYWLKRQITDLEQQYDDLLDSLGQLEVGNYPAGDFILKVTPNVRFDAATAKKRLTPEEFAAILVPTPNSALAKKVLGDERYPAAQKTYGVKRQIVPVTDEED